MATKTVALHHISARITNDDSLGFTSHGENDRMPHSVLGLEIVLVQNIIVGHVAVIACGHFTVRTVKPGHVLGDHDVTVHTGFGLIRKIREEIGNPYQKDNQAQKRTKQGSNAYPSPKGKIKKKIIQNEFEF